LFSVRKGLSRGRHPGCRLHASFFVRGQRAGGGARATSQWEEERESGCNRGAGEKLTRATCHDPHGSTAMMTEAERVSYTRGRCLSCHDAQTWHSWSAGWASGRLRWGHWTGCWSFPRTKKWRGRWSGRCGRAGRAVEAGSPGRFQGGDTGGSVSSKGRTNVIHGWAREWSAEASKFPARGGMQGEMEKGGGGQERRTADFRAGEASIAGASKGIYSLFGWGWK